MHGPEIMIPIFALMMPVMIIGLVLKHKAQMAQLRFQAEGDSAGTTARINELARRLEKIEQRMANLETIVIDTEKARQFDRSL